MGIFTYVPVWIIQDVLIYIIALITLFYILRKEEHPGRGCIQQPGAVYLLPQPPDSVCT